MTKIRHRFINHNINPNTKILIIGTFNPDTEENKADFFYGRQRNFLWTLIPTAFNEASLKGRARNEKLKFIEQYEIDFIDLISEVDVDEVANYDDDYLDSKVTIWKDVVSEIDKLKNLKQVCLTRKTFGKIPNMKTKIDEIKNHCDMKGINFTLLSTPARFVNETKQIEWTKFFRYDNR